MPSTDCCLRLILVREGRASSGPAVLHPGDLADLADRLRRLAGERAAPHEVNRDMANTPGYSVIEGPL